MSEWLDTAVAAEGGLLVRATSDRCADLLLREDHIAVSLGNDRAEYAWDDEWHIDTMAGLLWRITSVAAYNGDRRRLDVALYAPQDRASELVAATKRTRFSRALDGLATREDLIALHRYPSNSDRADLPPLQILTSLLREHPELRPGLSDEHTVREQIGRIPVLRQQAWDTPPSDEPFPRDDSVVLDAMNSAGLVLRDLRPLTRSELPPRDEVIEKVETDLRTNHPHRSAEISSETIERIVSERYLDVEPWAIEPLTRFQGG